MNICPQIAKHFREIHFGGNWTWSNLKDNLSGIDWKEATTKVQSFNTIAALVYHMNYYVSIVLKVLQGEPLVGSDKFSFDHPAVRSQEDWDKLTEKVFTEAERFAVLVEQLPDSKLEEIFIEEKYGTWYRNLHGIIEHTHYHLGQVVIIKKLLREKS
jgi:uncharacterized damage-inducible protein DinB